MLFRCVRVCMSSAVIETNVTSRVQEWQQGVAEALKANILNGSTSPTKARASSSKQGMQVRR